jgi:hypothetical protein
LSALDATGIPPNTIYAQPGGQGSGSQHWERLDARARIENRNNLHVFGDNFPAGTEREWHQVMPVGHRLNKVTEH